MNYIGESKIVFLLIAVSLLLSACNKKKSGSLFPIKINEEISYLEVDNGIIFYQMDEPKFRFIMDDSSSFYEIYGPSGPIVTVGTDTDGEFASHLSQVVQRGSAVFLVSYDNNGEIDKKVEMPWTKSGTRLGTTQGHR